jgi:hypothetical protein
MWSSVVVAAYLPLVCAARASNLPMWRSLTQPIVGIVIGATWLVMLTGFFFLVILTVPVGLFFAAIYLIPALSFMKRWHPWALSKWAMPFVVLWLILLERLAKRREAQCDPTQSPPRRRLAVIRDSVQDRWDVFRHQFFPIDFTLWGIGIVAAVVLVVPLVLVEYYAFGSDLENRHEVDPATIALAAVVGLAFGVGLGFIAALTGQPAED